MTLREIIGLIAWVVWLPWVTSCVYERTVTDSAGNVIYQEPEVHTPWESDENKRQEVIEKERELGY